MTRRLINMMYVVCNRIDHRCTALQSLFYIQYYQAQQKIFSAHCKEQE